MINVIISILCVQVVLLGLILWQLVKLSDRSVSLLSKGSKTLTSADSSDISPPVILKFDEFSVSEREEIRAHFGQEVEFVSAERSE